MLMKENIFAGAAGGKGFFLAMLFMALAFTWLAMSPCLDNGFTNWDEYDTVIHNPRIKTLSAESVKTIFSAPDLKMYTPLSTLSYAVNYHFAGLDPKIYHATDLLLHLANTALVMVLAFLLFNSAPAAFFIAILFGIHPAHVESVAWAAERKDVLSAFFYLASLTAYASRPGRAANYLLSFGLFICALFSKPMAVTLPAALLLIDYLKSEKLEARHLLNKIPFFVFAGGFSFILMSEPGNTFGMHWAKRLLVPLYNLGFYVYTLLWPFDLSALYSSAPGGKPAIYGLAAGAAAGMSLLWKYFRRDKEIVFGAAFYALMLLPVLQFFPFGPVISADRYTYLSSIGIFIIAAAAARRAWRRLSPVYRKVSAVCAVCAVLTLTTTSRLRCAVWKDSVSLWTSAMQKEPPGDYGISNLCDAYLQADMTNEAAACISRAIRVYPGNNDHHYNACRLLVQINEPAKAEACFTKMLAVSPCHAAALKYLGDIYLRKGETAKAERHYARSAQCDSSYAAAYLNLAKLALSRKDKTRAAFFYGKALSAEPADKEIRALLEAVR